MIKPLPVSGFYENLPEEQLVEETYKNIIKKNYSLSGFTPLDTPVIERLEILTSKGADDNEIYGLHRINGEQGDDASLGLRFDLTVPLARYIAQHEGVLSFPFKRQHIARVYRGERPQKGRYREFYQADIDIIGNTILPLFADVEVLSTLYNSLCELDFGNFVIHMNNKKFLSGFLLSLGISSKDLITTISIIDKKDKVSTEALQKMFEDIFLSGEQIQGILQYIKNAEQMTSQEIFDLYDNNSHTLLQEGLSELKYVYYNLLKLGVKAESLRINPAISRGLNYYTGTVFETFILGAETMGSISSGGRYEDLASHYTKNKFPGVGGSIGLSRLLAVLRELGKLEYSNKTTTEVLVISMGEENLEYNISVLSFLRKNNIASELYIDANAKIQKQFKYANNKNIPYVLIAGEEEQKKGIVQLKKLSNGEQKEISLEQICDILL